MLTKLVGAGAVSLVVLWFTLVPAGAQPEPKTETLVSVCLNPATPALIARTIAERENKACKEWSQIAGASRVFDILQFVNCKNPKEALGSFLAAVLRTWNGQYPAVKPTTSEIYGTPGKFRLRPIRPDESPIEALMVWKGMAALVVADVTKPGDAPNWRRLRVLYPAKSDCGKLVEDSAEHLASDLMGRGTIDRADRYKLLVARHPRLFWNYWVERAGPEPREEQPNALKVGNFYNYKIAFSALDFAAVLQRRPDARDRVRREEVDQYLPPLDSYRVSVLPIGDKVSAEPRTHAVSVDAGTLKRTLTLVAMEPAGGYADLARRHNALSDLDREDLAPVSFRVHAEKPGCHALAVIVWTEAPKRIVTSWLRRFRVVSDDGAGEEPPGDCGEITASRPVGPSVIPWFDTANDADAVARLVFIDFGEYSIGSYQDLQRNDEAPISWVVQEPLRVGLARFGDFVNERVKNSRFEFSESSNQLARLLFSCRDVSVACDGQEALVRLRDLAVNHRGARVQTSFRDIVSNSTYYIPIHLLEASEGILLARHLQFSQPFPVPKRPIGQGDECVREWSGGLIVEDIEDRDIDEWRKGFLPVFTASVRHSLFSQPRTLNELRDDYFHAVDLKSSAPEGLVLLAHHGDGDISDRKARDPLTRITPEDVKRQFRTGSIALLVACSVGALGNLDTSSSRMMFKFNERDIRAAVVSPFQVTPLLAQRFLENFKATITEQTHDISLYELLEKTKQRLRSGEAPEDQQDGLQAAVDVFMVVGDGVVPVCKAGGQ